ncbi:unnamed protein product [Rotaria socialis]|uniref:Uncharacterized protein n=2 Tax=Rotaria socialis TaxID=392032 RepID=A0A817SL63_9BILA|nr:unnamed protein product [Rotaria socialis]CAF3381528.1 unnamed protein product [Rotaria socialis]CAF3776573.1 unnamed protein product [Rotaria socialis]CAF4095020.1 unnamed protein product [Rotaria socialis]CAF4493522.1 unnamed protein product [Rotaria socialis]
MTVYAIVSRSTTKLNTFFAFSIESHLPFRRQKNKKSINRLISEKDLDQFTDEYVFENFDVANTWSTPPRLTRDNIYAAIITMDLSGFKQNIYEFGILSTPMKELSSSSIFHASPLPNILLQIPTHDRLKSVTNASHNASKLIPACLPTPNPSSPNFAARFRADVVQLIEANNIHRYSDTCLDNRS